MTTRERFQRVIQFQPVDRLPMMEWAVWWDKTVDRWKDEGLVIMPAEGLSEGEALQLQMGLDLQTVQIRRICTVFCYTTISRSSVAMRAGICFSAMTFCTSRMPGIYIFW